MTKFSSHRGTLSMYIEHKVVLFIFSYWTRLDKKWTLYSIFPVEIIHRLVLLEISVHLQGILPFLYVWVSSITTGYQLYKNIKVVHIKQNTFVDSSIKCELYNILKQILHWLRVWQNYFHKSFFHNLSQLNVIVTSKKHPKDKYSVQKQEIWKKWGKDLKIKLR
jgi:hypothetical protein